MNISKKVWLLISKDKKFIATTAFGKKYFVSVDNKKETKHPSLYSSACNAISDCENVSICREWSLEDALFYSDSENMEAVECTLSITPN